MLSEQYVLSRRERKKLNCKYAILQAARELIMEHGVDVLIEDIANRANISYPTFYNYFPTKANLFYAIYLEELEDIREFIDIELKDETSARRRIERLFAAVIRDFLRYRYLDLYIAGEVARHTQEEGGEEQISLLFAENIRQGVACGELKAGTDIRHSALLITGIIFSASANNCNQEDQLQMLAILLDGLGA